MPVRRRVARRVTELTLEQWASLEFGMPEVFATDLERRESWAVHRETLLADSNHGQRPSGWWDYDSPVNRESGREQAQLMAMGELSEVEVEYVHARWRERVTLARLLVGISAQDARAARREYLARLAMDGVPPEFSECNPTELSEPPDEGDVVGARRYEDTVRAIRTQRRV